MQNVQVHFKKGSNVDAELAKLKNISPQLVLLFGNTEYFTEDGLAKRVSAEFPHATVIGCSTAGEISNSGVFDETLVVTGTAFEKANLRSAWADVKSMSTTAETGQALGERLNGADLKAVFVLGCGLDINGSALIKGMKGVLKSDVIVTGGLAGDSGLFQKTFTLLNGQISDRQAVAFGIYGKDVQVAFGSMGGWEAFGPIRRVTNSASNVLFELDGEPALDIYKKYLGDKVANLPFSGLLYPFALLKDNHDNLGLIRTILAVNEEEKSLTFAGDIPMGGLVRLMHTNNEGLVAGAKTAAESAFQDKSDTSLHENALSILISCVGRKLIMGDEVEDELDVVREVLGEGTVIGFYSYGEICPQGTAADCRLHNQTMTVTHFYEKRPA